MQNTNEQINESLLAKAAQFILMRMLSSQSGRDFLSKICLALPNLIERLCDAQFADTDVNGQQLGNLKTKLCKAVGYGSTYSFSIPMKIAGEMILLLDDKTTNAIIGGVQAAQSPTPSPVSPPPPVMVLPDKNIMEGVVDSNEIRRQIRQSILENYNRKIN